MISIDNINIGFIGAGNMAEAIFSGIKKTKKVKSENIYVACRNDERLNYLKKKYRVNTLKTTGDEKTCGNIEIVKKCDVVILAVKPQFMRDVLTPLAKYFDKSKSTLVSILGGSTLQSLEDIVKDIAVIRIMPNTPMLVCEGVSGIALGKYVDKNKSDLVSEIFKLVGSVYILPEKLIDPLTSISGCGPAFVYMFIEAMADGGVKMGLGRDMAIKLSAQTLLGASKMVLETNTHPAILKDNVCSPLGSTIAGVHKLESNCFRGSVIDAVETAMKRMEEIGKSK